MYSRSTDRERPATPRARGQAAAATRTTGCPVELWIGVIAPLPTGGSAPVGDASAGRLDLDPGGGQTGHRLGDPGLV
jgi:hypothetical protein